MEKILDIFAIRDYNATALWKYPIIQKELTHVRIELSFVKSVLL